MRIPVNIAVCEDTQTDADRLTSLIMTHLSGNAHIKIDRYPNGEALIARFESGMYDIIFLDIYMGGMTGIETAKAIRSVDDRCAIVFTTVSPEFALESYRVRAAHYLIKPVSPGDLREVWRRILADVEHKKERIVLVVDRKPVDLPLSSILYAEARGKILRVHSCGDVVIETRLTIEQFEHMLPLPPFCRCHRGFIVNFDHIKDIGDDFVMKNGDTVYIRQTERARIRDAYFRHLVNRAKRSAQGERDRVF